MKEQLAEIHVMIGENIKVIHTDHPEMYTKTLKQRNEMFICYPGSMPIPRNKTD